MDTKLTVNLPEALRRRARAVAALRGETVSDVVRTALEAYIAEAFEEAEDIRAADAVEACLVSGATTLHEHADVWREIEALEAAGALPDPLRRRG